MHAEVLVCDAMRAITHWSRASPHAAKSICPRAIMTRSGWLLGTSHDCLDLICLTVFTGDMLLLKSINQFLSRVSHILKISLTNSFSFLDPCVDREEPSLVDFLRLDQLVDPLLLSLLKSLDKLLLVL